VRLVEEVLKSFDDQIITADFIVTVNHLILAEGFNLESPEE
jgi:hypothetical protein